MSTQGQKALRRGRIMAEMERRVNSLMNYGESHPEASAADLEGKARELSQGIFACALEGLIEERRQEAEKTPRCECGREMAYKGDRVRRQETYVGRIEWRRGYFYCRHCRRGRYPLDDALGMANGQFSDGVQAGVSWLAALMPFEAAGKTFTYLVGIGISGREVERLSEGRGTALETRQAWEREELLRGEGFTNSKARERPGVWAVALDAAKGRFHDGWHDVHVGATFWARPKIGGDEVCGTKAGEQSYVVQVGSLSKAGERLYAETIRRGIEPGRDLIICLSDGAVGNWNQFALHFPKRVEILDWWHAVDHLWAAGKGVFGEGTTEAKAWVEARKTELWEGRVDSVLAALRAEAAKAGGKAAADEVHYFETNRERMRYNEFRVKGYPIGSGTVESACKRVIIARMRQSGMCWTQPGAQAVLTLRAELLSDRWPDAWRATRPLAKAA